MFKKLMCLALSIMMVLCTIQVTGFAADYSQGDLVASHVTFTTAGGATINVKNVASEGSATAVFWLGEYVDGVLVESDFVEADIAAGANVDLSLAVTKDTDSVLKAYIWEGVLRGKAIAPVATYPSSSTEIKYALKNGEAWADFNADTLTYDIELERTEFTIPDYDFYAADNSTAITEPAAYVQGANTVTATAADGTVATYTLNISYKAPAFRNFFAAGSGIKESEIFVVQNKEVLLNGANYDALLEEIGEGGLKGTSGYIGYPAKKSNGTVDSPSRIHSYPAALGYDVGELYIFRSTKGPSNNTPYYANGVGAYDGTNGSYFMTFDLDASGTMYVVLVEGTTGGTTVDSKAANLVKEGYTKITAIGNTYAKHYEAGETVKVPSMGWDSEKLPATGRTFQNSSLFLFGYDDGFENPVVFDKSDTKLKEFTYSADGGAYVTVDGFDVADEGGEYNITLPTGTESVTVRAAANEGFSRAVADPASITFTEENGSGTSVVTVTAFDGSAATYTVNFTVQPAVEDDASLKSLSYTIADGTAVELDLSTAVANRVSATLPADTLASDVKVSAEASVGDKAKVEIVDVTAWNSNKMGTATVTVTAIDGVTVATYYVDFAVEKYIYETPNKIYDLTSTADKVKTENNGYQTEAEAASTGLKNVVIGENLTADSYLKFNNAKKYAPTADMIGASYLRTQRYYGTWAGYALQTNSTITKKLYENGDDAEPTVTTIAASTGIGGEANQLRIFKVLENPVYTDPDSTWLTFKVTSDCIVVVRDNSGYGYPNINPEYTPNSGWTKSDGTTNSLGGNSYYKSFSAGDTVVIPSYGLAGKLADETKIVYEYTDSNGAAGTKTTTVANSEFWTGWDGGNVIAVKWTHEISDDTSLASVKVGGVEADLSAMDANNTITAYAAADAGELALEVTATSGAATVVAPATVSVGETASIVVTAESGIITTYYVKVEAKDTANTQLSSLQYKIGDGEWTDVENFDSDTLGGTYAAAPAVYSEDGVAVAIKGVTLTTSTELTADGTLTFADSTSLTINVVSEDGTVTTPYIVTFTMAEKAFDATVVGTAEYQALFKTGSYTGSYVITKATAPTYTQGTANMITWDENGYAKNRKYSITVDGAAYTQGDTKEFMYSSAMAVKAEQEAAGKTVVLTPGSFNYGESKVTTMIGSAFNAGTYHTTGAMGSAFANANFQIMTNREIAPSRVASGNEAYNDTTATRNFLLSKTNYLMEVTPNSKATVYIAFNSASGKTHQKFIDDGWTLIDSSEAMSKALAEMPEENFIDEYKNITSKAWYMVKADTVIEDVPYMTIKVQPDTGSNTLGQTFPYVWYKTIEEDETLKVPTPGIEDQHAYKGFIIKGDHVAWTPEGEISTALTSVTYEGGSATKQTDGSYYIEVASEIASVTITATAEAADAVVSYAPSNTVALEAGVEKIVTVTVTAGEAVENYTVKILRKIDSVIGGIEDGGDIGNN